SAPLAPLALDAEDTRLAQRVHRATADGDLPHPSVVVDRDEEEFLLNAPALVVPLADGFAQNRNPPRLKRAFPDRTRIAERLILDGARQRSAEVLGTDMLAALRQHVAVPGLH